MESIEVSSESQMFHVVKLHSCQPKGNKESYEKEDGNWIDINEDTNSSYTLMLRPSLQYPTTRLASPPRANHIASDTVD